MLARPTDASELLLLPSTRAATDESARSGIGPTAAAAAAPVASANVDEAKGSSRQRGTAGESGATHTDCASAGGAQAKSGGSASDAAPGSTAAACFAAELALAGAGEPSKAATMAATLTVDSSAPTAPTAADASAAEGAEASPAATSAALCAAASRPEPSAASALLLPRPWGCRGRAGRAASFCACAGGTGLSGRPAGASKASV
jgi:hypothetical protein